jgi:hypothetical protein
LTRDQSFGIFAPFASSLFRALRHVMLAKDHAAHRKPKKLHRASINAFEPQSIGAETTMQIGFLDLLPWKPTVSFRGEKSFKRFLIKTAP